MILADWQSTVEAVATAAGVLVGTGALVAAALAAWFAWGQLKEMNRARHAQAIADMSRRWDEDLAIQARHGANEYRNPEGLRDKMLAFKDANDEKYYELLREPNFFEDLAIMEQRGAIDFDAIRKSLGRLAVSRWLYWEPTINAMRESERSVSLYENFEDLADRMTSALTQPATTD